MNIYMNFAFYKLWFAMKSNNTAVVPYICSDGEAVDLYLKTNIEGAIINWAQQIHDLLKEDSYIGI